VTTKIERVGKGLAIPADAKVIDLSQMTVLPGLIDCQPTWPMAHRRWRPLLATKKTAAQVAFESVPNARHFCEKASPPFVTWSLPGVDDVAMRDAIAHGFIEGRACMWLAPT